VNRHKEHEIQKISTTLHNFFIEKDIEHVILSGGACKKCQKCSKIINQQCKKPNSKLTSMEAVGIDCQKTLTSAGFDFTMPAKNSINRCTAVLFDCNDLSTINWKKNDSHQTFKKVSKNKIQLSCDILQSKNPKMIESIQLIPISEINHSELCNGCDHYSKNFACPPYSDKIDFTEWDHCILWKWNKNNVKKYSYNTALKLIHTSLFSLGLYFAISVRDCYCEECPICEYEKSGSPVCNFRKIMSPSMQSQGINPNQFGAGKYGLVFI
jgi:predicted metal-binding protein